MRRFAVKLGGAMADKTIALNGCHFVDGLLHLPRANPTETLQNWAGLIKYFETSYQGTLIEVNANGTLIETSAASNSDVRQEGKEPSTEGSAFSDVDADSENGATGSVSSGNGYEDSGLPDTSWWGKREHRINEAVMALDSSNDEDWTSNGLPRVEAVSALLEDATITRAEITSIAPEFSRESLTV